MSDVRPTFRALRDLGLAVPDIAVCLPALNDEQVQQVQRTPAVVEAGGGKRIVELVDRVWWKHKFKDIRGAVVQLDESELDTRIAHADRLGGWWVAAFGERRDDSPQSDFYVQLVAECKRAAKGTPAATQTACLLPEVKDWNRLVAERAHAIAIGMQRMIRQAIAQTLKTGVAVSLEADSHVITVTVRQPEGDEAYLVIRAFGVPNAKDLAVILASVPGVNPADWQPAGASDIEGLGPEFDQDPGQIVWATYLPEKSRELVLAEASGALASEYTVG